MAKKKILMVDDDNELLDLYGSALDGEGYEVVQATNGEAGIKVFNEARENGQPFDLILTDYSMPGIDGDEFVRRIRKIEETNDLTRVSIVAHSGAMNEFIRNAFKQAGADVMLNKWEIYSAIEAIGTLLNRENEIA